MPDAPGSPGGSLRRNAVMEMALVLMRGFQLQPPAATAKDIEVGNTKLLGIEVYTQYLYPLQLAAVLLLVAIIAAIALTLRARKDSKHMNPSEQVRAKKAGRVRLVKMAPTIEAPSVPKDVPKQEGQA